LKIEVKKKMKDIFYFWYMRQPDELALKSERVSILQKIIDMQ